MVKILLVIPLIGVILYLIISNANKPGQYDSFAKCLTDKGAKMYGAYWCSHCQNQKKQFGSSWKYINYVECALSNGSQAPVCRDAKIEGYPTWEFQDGERVSGELSFDTLMQKTGCFLD